MEWLVRTRPSGWSLPDLVQEIFDSGCHLAPVGRGKRVDEPIDTVNYCQNPEAILAASGALPAESNAEGKRAMEETEWRTWQKICLGKAFLPCSDISWFCLR